jgi:hypothetical protein
LIIGPEAAAAMITIFAVLAIYRRKSFNGVKVGWIKQKTPDHWSKLLMC